MNTVNKKQPNKLERRRIIKRLKDVGYSQRRFSIEILGKTPQQFTQMLNAEQPGMYKETIEKLEELEQLKTSLN